VTLSGAPAPAPPPRETVAVAANSTGMNHLWAWWGTRRGIYARHGLDVTPVDNVADGVTALVSGQVQFVAHGVQTHSGAVKGLPIRAVMVTFRDNLGVYADPSITSIPALKGKRIIGPYDILKELFKRQGMDPENDVTWVVSRTSVQQQLQMVREGEADAASGFPPGKLLAERVGLHQVFVTSDYFPGAPVSVVGTTTALLQERPDLVKRVLAGTLDTLDDMRSNREAIVAYMMEEWSFDRALAEGSYETIAQDLIPTGIVPEEPLRVMLEATKSAQETTADIPLDQVWDFRLLQEVLRDRGR
jgi:ABC-type nitrate/sulfonate/bicarbonate transport system substrate-binding protein